MRLRKPLASLAVAVLVYVSVTPAAAQYHHWGDGWMHDGAGWMGGMGWFGMITMLVWLVLLLLVPLAVLYWLFGRGGESDGDRAMQLLREQYARGEIDDDEFEKRRSRLERN